VGYEIAAKAYGRRMPDVVVDIDSDIPSERMLAATTDLSGCEQAAARHAELAQDLFHLGVPQAVDAFAFTVALAFCIAPAPWLPRTNAPTEEANPPALIG
jgi:hypothetical protein